MISNRIAILKTLSYHEIFSYPLTMYQLYFYLIESNKQMTQLESDLRNTPSTHVKNIHYSISEKSIHNQNNHYSNWLNIQYAQSTLKPLYFIPWIELVAVTGSTAALNASHDNDIDIMIITKNNTGWFVRLLTLLFLNFKGLRAKYDSQNNRKFCINLVLEDNEVSQIKQDLFSAMEIAHMKVIYNKNNRAYMKMLKNNEWLHQYLPNFWISYTHDENLEDSNQNASYITAFINTIAKKIQQNSFSKKFKRKLTRTDTWIHDYRTVILQKYEESIQNIESR